MRGGVNVESAFELLVAALDRATSRPLRVDNQHLASKHLTNATEDLVVVILRVAFIAEVERRGLLAAGQGHAPAAGVRRLTRAEGGSRTTLSSLFSLWARGFSSDGLRLPAGHTNLFCKPRPLIENIDDSSSGWLDTDEVSRLVRFLVPSAQEPRCSEDRLGGAYEQLLELKALRLCDDAICLLPSRHWITGADVFKQPPANRAKWLQRATSLPKSAVHALAEPLARAPSAAAVLDILGRCQYGHGGLWRKGRWVVQCSSDRRRSGAHYTPPELTHALVRKTLQPLVLGQPAQNIRSLRICDAAVGSGAFLLEAARFLESALAIAKCEPNGGSRSTRRQLLEQCLFGIDINPVALELAKLTLTLWALDVDELPPDLEKNLRLGNALIGLPFERRTAALAGRPRRRRRGGSQPNAQHSGARTGAANGEASENPSYAEVNLEISQRLKEEPTARWSSELGLDSAQTISSGEPFFHWTLAFAEVFTNKQGFDAFVGNPPWVAYAGRAAQPLAAPLHAYYQAENPAFAGFRTLHGLFIRRCAALLRPGGRLGLVIPTSVADLAGYAPARRAHDELCVVDPQLLDFGDGAFDGVFQPCMGLTSTRRQTSKPSDGSTWTLERPDLTSAAQALLERLSRHPLVPPELFGERGYQTAGDDLSFLRRLGAPEAPFAVAVREGIDVGEFRLHPPRVFAHVERLTGRFRSEREWRSVAVLIRQTARFPIAAQSDGMAFRNSILAGFAIGAWTAPRLLGYLNSSLVRWLHFHRHRDARQGMPQLKVGHLRALPCPSADALARLDAAALGPMLRNTGITDAERCAVDAAVFDAFEIPPSDRALVMEWSAAHRPPVPRPKRE